MKIKGKRGISNLITIILIILIILVLIFILWSLIRSILITQSEISIIKSGLIGENIDFEDVEGDLLTPKQINLTINRGPGKTILKNTTIIEYYADIVFIIDSTGSMSDEIGDVKDTIGNFGNKLEERNLNYRFGLIEFKDYPASPCGYSHEFPSKIYEFSTGDFTSNLTEFLGALNEIIVSGGGDYPESHLTAIKNASQDLTYGTQETLKKFIILLTDDKPHAIDCLDSETSTDNVCNAGPNNIGDQIDNLKNNDIGFYYINKNTGLCGNEKMLEMVTETGGRFYNYSEIEGIEKIILSITTEIIKEYGLEEYDHLKIMFYNDTMSFEYRLYDMPFPLETQTYSVPDIDLENYELSDKITNITRIEIYQVVTTNGGSPVIGPLLDSWSVK